MTVLSPVRGLLQVLHHLSFKALYDDREVRAMGWLSLRHDAAEVSSVFKCLQVFSVSSPELQRLAVLIQF